MPVKELQAVCDEVFGKRGASGDQEPTGAAGVWANFQAAGKTIFFMAKQGGPFQGTAPDGIQVFDARLHVVTSRKMNEWTGYHAEMIIVSAMLSALRAGNLLIGQGASGMEKYNKFLGTMVAANAPCCAHCDAMLGALGIERPEKAGPRSKTAWWNPLTDERFENGTTAFNVTLPGGSTLKGKPGEAFT